MANLSIRNEPALGAFVPDAFADPFQSMRELMRWDPFSDISRWPGARMSTVAFNPSFDVKETADAIILQADLPGVAEKDLDLSLTDTRLTISGKREFEQEKKGETYYRSERSYGSFSRTFTLPTQIDTSKVSAELKSGVLMVTLPKSGESTTRHIAVKGEKRS